MAVNRKRCFFAAVGISVGIAAVTILASLGYISQQELAHELVRLGTNVVIIESARSPLGRSRPGSMVATLTEEDITALKNGVEGIATIAPVMLSQGEVVNDAGAVRTDIIATTAPFLQIRKMQLSQGTLFSDAEYLEAQKVIVLGRTIATLLFGDADPIGDTVDLNNTPFAVIGVLAEQGLDANGEDQDDVVIIPLTTAHWHGIMDTQQYLTHIYIEATRADMVPEVKEGVAPVLRDAHQLDADDPDHFNVYDQTQLLAARSDILGSVDELIYVLAAITSLAGSLGITAVQLISIRERTWEIGLHRALGARKRDIRVQLLTMQHAEPTVSTEHLIHC